MSIERGKDWADLTSAERLEIILLVIADARRGEATASYVAYTINGRHRMERPRHGNHGRGNVARAMSLATRVTPGITALRRRGLIGYARRSDGLSGGADVLTAAGMAHLTGQRR